MAQQVRVLQQVDSQGRTFYEVQGFDGRHWVYVNESKDKKIAVQMAKDIDTPTIVYESASNST